MSQTAPTVNKAQSALASSRSSPELDAERTSPSISAGGALTPSSENIAEASATHIQMTAETGPVVPAHILTSTSADQLVVIEAVGENAGESGAPHRMLRRVHLPPPRRHRGHLLHDADVQSRAVSPPQSVHREAGRPATASSRKSHAQMEKEHTVVRSASIRPQSVQGLAVVTKDESTSGTLPGGKAACLAQNRAHIEQALRRRQFLGGVTRSPAPRRKTSPPSHSSGPNVLNGSADDSVHPGTGPEAIQPDNVEDTNTTVADAQHGLVQTRTADGGGVVGDTPGIGRDRRRSAMRTDPVHSRIKRPGRVGTGSARAVRLGVLDSERDLFNRWNSVLSISPVKQSSKGRAEPLSEDSRAPINAQPDRAFRGQLIQRDETLRGTRPKTHFEHGDSLHIATIAPPDAQRERLVEQHVSDALAGTVNSMPLSPRPGDTEDRTYAPTHSHDMKEPVSRSLTRPSSAHVLSGGSGVESPATDGTDWSWSAGVHGGALRLRPRTQPSKRRMRPATARTTREADHGETDSALQWHARIALPLKDIAVVGIGSARSERKTTRLDTERMYPLEHTAPETPVVTSKPDTDGAPELKEATEQKEPNEDGEYALNAPGMPLSDSHADYMGVPLATLNEFPADYMGVPLATLDEFPAAEEARIDSYSPIAYAYPAVDVSGSDEDERLLDGNGERAHYFSHVRRQVVVQERALAAREQAERDRQALLELLRNAMSDSDQRLSWRVPVGEDSELLDKAQVRQRPHTAHQRQPRPSGAGNNFISAETKTSNPAEEFDAPAGVIDHHDLAHGSPNLMFLKPHYQQTKVRRPHSALEQRTAPNNRYSGDSKSAPNAVLSAAVTQSGVLYGTLPSSPHVMYGSERSPSPTRRRTRARQAKVQATPSDSGPDVAPNSALPLNGRSTKKTRGKSSTRRRKGKAKGVDDPAHDWVSRVQSRLLFRFPAPSQVQRLCQPKSTKASGFRAPVYPAPVIQAGVSDASQGHSQTANPRARSPLVESIRGMNTSLPPEKAMYGVADAALSVELESAGATVGQGVVTGGISLPDRSSSTGLRWYSEQQLQELYLSRRMQQKREQQSIHDLEIRKGHRETVDRRAVDSHSGRVSHHNHTRSSQRVRGTQGEAATSKAGNARSMAAGMNSEQVVEESSPMAGIRVVTRVSKKDDRPAANASVADATIDSFDRGLLDMAQFRSATARETGDSAYSAAPVVTGGSARLAHRPVKAAKARDGTINISGAQQKMEMRT